MQQPAVSICIPAYNSARFLAESVRSACQQTYPNVIVWVSDDASTDTTPALMEQLCHEFPKLRYHRHLHNLGIRDNVDWILRKVDSEHIVRLDADDCLYPTYVEILIKLLLKYPKAGWAHAAVKEIDLNGNELKIRRLFRFQEFQNGAQALKNTVYGYRVAANICMFRTQALQEVNFLTNNPMIGEDYALSVKLADQGWGNVYSPLILSSYRVWGGTQWSLNRRILELEGLIQIYEDLLTPAFRRRNWSTRKLSGVRHQRALNEVGILLYKGVDEQKYEEILNLLYKLGDSWQLRIGIMLAQKGFYKYIWQMQKLTWWVKRQAKKIISFR